MDGELPGGNMNAVVRVGDTVRRTAGPWTPTVHRYLEYLAAAGVDWAPKPLGIEGETEILTFVDGEVPLYPLPDWVWTDAALVDAARHLRQLHDASIGFGMDRAGFGSERAIWQSPSKIPAEVICHNDFAPHNLAFVDGQIVGAIDFDMCSPGPRIWDLAYLATRMVPLTDPTGDGATGELQTRRRIQLLLDSYGSDARWTEVVRIAIVRLRDLAVMSIAKAEELARPGLADDALLYERDATYLEGVLAALR
jgi:aminoglycoside phosphotransferase (APT) family kinase protein